MPLQDSFGKKAAKKPPEAPKPAIALTKALPNQPTVDDISFCLMTARASVRQPMMLTWRKGQRGYLLTVTCTPESYEPIWILHYDDGQQLTVLWQYRSTDPGLIHGLISENVGEPAAAAVIPEDLKRPKQKNADEPRVFENWEITETLGKGGMGVIYKAREMAGGDVVALKILKADLLVDPSNVELFKHEASVASSLAHPNLLRVREFGFSRYGQPFITMDYLDGVELKKLLHDHGRLDLPTFVNIFTQICDALAYAHDKGLVHRDLKPSNIMLVKSAGGQDTVKIIDFGIAKLGSAAEAPRTAVGIARSGAATTTTTGSFVGSPAYMSPEQCMGARLDNRSDIYSLGCVMYEAISGKLPFKSENVLMTIMSHINDPAVPFAIRCPDVQVPEELEQIIMKALQKDPADRYQTARELCEDLWSFAALGSSSRRDGGAAAGLAQMFENAEEPDPLPIERAFDSEETLPTEPPVHVSSVQVVAPVKLKLTRTLQQNPLSDKAYTLLRWSGILTDQLIKVVTNCEQMLDQGEITAEQAIAVIKHSFAEAQRAQQEEEQENSPGEQYL